MSKDKKLKSSSSMSSSSLGSSSSLSDNELGDISGGIANPIYTKYLKDGKLINPDTGKEFKSEKDAWAHYRNRNF